MRLAAVATYALVSGLSFFVQLTLCARCGSDNAYLGEVLLGALLAFVGVVLGLTWFALSRRDGATGIRMGLVPAVGVAAVIVLVGAAQILVPPVLALAELVVVIAGAIGLAVIARSTHPVSPTRDREA